MRHSFDNLRSTQVATVHCSAQTAPSHVLQKLGQTCMVISTNTGRVYRPKDCERLVLYLKDLNLPKPDKWGTSQLIAFLQQVCFFWFIYSKTKIQVRTRIRPPNLVLCCTMQNMLTLHRLGFISLSRFHSSIATVPVFGMDTQIWIRSESVSDNINKP